VNKTLANNGEPHDWLYWPKQLRVTERFSDSRTMEMSLH